MKKLSRGVPPPLLYAYGTFALMHQLLTHLSFPVDHYSVSLVDLNNLNDDTSAPSVHTCSVSANVNSWFIYVFPDPSSTFRVFEDGSWERCVAMTLEEASRTNRLRDTKRSLLTPLLILHVQHSKRQSNSKTWRFILITMF